MRLKNDYVLSSVVISLFVEQSERVTESDLSFGLGKRQNNSCGPAGNMLKLSVGMSVLVQMCVCVCVCVCVCACVCVCVCVYAKPLGRNEWTCSNVA